MASIVPRPSRGPARTIPEVTALVKLEYYEMPGLALTQPQAQQLFGLDAVTCEAVLGALVDSGFLHRTNKGTYVRRRNEGETIQRIRRAVRSGKLIQPFKAAAVNRALGVTFAWTFLPKHRIGSPGCDTELFLRVGRGEYRLSPDQQALVDLAAEVPK